MISRRAGFSASVELVVSYTDPLPTKLIGKIIYLHSPGVTFLSVGVLRNFVAIVARS